MSVGGSDVYAKELVASNLDEPCNNDVFRSILRDLQDKGCANTEEIVGNAIDALIGEAKNQLFGVALAA